MHKNTGIKRIVGLLGILSLAFSIFAHFNLRFPGDLFLTLHAQSLDGQLLLSITKWVSFIFDGWHSALATVVIALMVWWRLGRQEAVLIVAAGLLTAFDSPLKLVVGRPRPTADLVRVFSQESGNGFPSGHAMFSILVFGLLAWFVFKSVKNKALSAIFTCALIILVLFIGFSRVYLGVHWTSDVLGGYLIGGMLAAMLVWLHQVWDGRRRRQEKASTRLAGLNNVKAELIYNPRSGQVIVRHEIEEAAAYLNGRGWNVTGRETTRPGEATELARAAVRNGAEVVIAAGGDGTVSEVANGLVHTDAALGVIPVGTNNSWAMQVGIPTLNPWSAGTNVVKLIADIEERIARPLSANYYRSVILGAAEALADGKTVRVDVGEVDGRHFLMWAGIGLDAEILESISPKDKKTLGSWAYLITTIGTLGRHLSSDVRMILDGEEKKIGTQEIIINNIQLYGGMLEIGARAKLNDGLLDVCIFKGESFFTFIQHALKVLSHQHLHDPMVDYYQRKEIIIESATALPVHLDGDPFTKTPVVIRAVPSALNVIIPADAPENLFVNPL